MLTGAVRGPDRRAYYSPPSLEPACPSTRPSLSARVHGAGAK